MTNVSFAICSHVPRMTLQQPLQGDLSFKSHLSFHADIHKDAAIFIPTADAFQITGAALVVDDKGSNTMPEAFFEHEKSTNPTIAVFKRADTFEPCMEIQNLVKANAFL